MANGADRIANQIGSLAIANRKIDFGGGCVGYFGSSYEERLNNVIEMGETLRHPAFSAIVTMTYERLIEGWKTELANINEAVELMRTINSSRQIPVTQVDAMKESIQAELLKGVLQGCRADELRELIPVIDTSDPESETVATARQAYEAFRGNFQKDLSECKSGSQFDGLTEDLECFRDNLGVDVSRLLVLVEDEKSEFEEHEDAYADHMHDEWKDRYRDQRGEDRGLTHMFGSLGGDGE